MFDYALETVRPHEASGGLDDRRLVLPGSVHFDRDDEVDAVPEVLRRCERVQQPPQGSGVAASEHTDDEMSAARRLQCGVDP